jgi:hypothetical protein
MSSQFYILLHLKHILMRQAKVAEVIFQQRCVFSHVPRARTQWIDRLEDFLIMCCSNGVRVGCYVLSVL